MVNLVISLLTALTNRLVDPKVDMEILKEAVAVETLRVAVAVEEEATTTTPIRSRMGPNPKGRSNQRKIPIKEKMESP